MPKIANIMFNTNFFNAYMKNKFGESFAHSSLSFERVFNAGNEAARELEMFISDENIEYAELLNSGSIEEQQLLLQRLNEVKQALEYLGIPKEKIRLSDTEEDFSVCIGDYIEYIVGAVRPYRNNYELNRAIENDLVTGKRYEYETVLSKVNELASLINKKSQADIEAKNLKRGNNEAFMYALEQKDVSIPTIIKINSLVNTGSGLYQGFKRVNNKIEGSRIQTCDKEYVSSSIQELLHNYYNVWSKDIPSFVEGVNTYEEKEEYLKAICVREAKFHIEFERIHPFEDGNGRTGRIILNRNLIKNELAPILITPQMRNIYLKCIETRDYETFGELIYMLSSVELTTMVSEYRRVKGIEPSAVTEIKSGTLVAPGNSKSIKKVFMR